MKTRATPPTALWRAALAQVENLLEQPDHERAAALAALSGKQPELHTLVHALLRAQGDAENSGFLEPRKHEEPLCDGATLGPYRIVSRLGSGGMGEVWLARRSDGLFEGEVAIKTLHPWFARGALRERFLREAQLLGKVSHPNISRLLDAGATPDGSMYLVLEYVRGVPLDQYCDEQRLALNKRLGLFLDVCAAVTHAHSHLIVHRDLKPSNILVTADGEVKLLDFGVATLLDAEAAASSDLTRLTGRVFTPEFAAPEQLRGETVTTATDVYSLGVILHLLLTGQRPHAPQGISAAAIEHAVLHEEATVPSRALRAVTDERVAEARASTLTRLRRELAGDLDNIVARTLEKNPASRYAGVPALSDDIIRHLRHLPVRARAASARYRFAKFVRRHRLPAAIGALALLAVLGGATLALWQANVARVEARKANAIRDFLVGVFERNSVAHPDGARARKTTAEELLAQSAREIRTGLADAPEVRRELLGVMARLYSTLDLQPQAIELLEAKLLSARAAHGNESLEVAATLSDLAMSQTLAGNYAAGERSAREALRIFQSLGDEPTIEHARAYAALALIAYRTDTQQSGTMRRHYTEALRMVSTHHPHDALHIEMLMGLGRSANLDSDFRQELENNQRALELIENGTVKVNGMVHGSVLQAVGSALVWLNRYDEAEQYLRRAMEVLDRAGGSDHPLASDSRRELGTMLMWTGRRADARRILGEALSTHERMRGIDDPELTAFSRSDVASNLYLRGELAEAEPHMVRNLDNWESVDNSVMVPKARINLARLQTQQGRFEEAAASLEGLEPRTIELFGDGSWMHTVLVARAGELALARGDLARAEEYFQRLCTKYAEPPGQMSTNRAAGREGMVRVALARGDSAGARELATRLISDIEASAGRRELPDQEASAHLLLGVALLGQGQAGAARPEIERALAMREAMDAPQSLWLAEVRLQLARVLHALGATADARQQVSLAAQAHRIQGRVGPQYARLLTDTRAALAVVSPAVAH